MIETLMPPTTIKGIRSFFYMLDSLEYLKRTSQKILDHYADCWKRMPNLNLMIPALLHLKKLNPDWLQLPSWQHQTETKILKSCVMLVIMQWE